MEMRHKLRGRETKREINEISAVDVYISQNIVSDSVIIFTCI